MWGLPFGTFLSFIVLVVSVVVAILWGIFSSKDDLEDPGVKKS
jgi:hypothetical protein